MRVCVNAATRPASRRPRHRSWAAGLATLLRSVLLPHVCVREREKETGGLELEVPGRHVVSDRRIAYATGRPGESPRRARAH